jgi:hypothetical protein
MKKIILILATLLIFSISAKSQQQQTLVGFVQNTYIPMGISKAGYTLFKSPIQVVTNPLYTTEKLTIFNGVLTMGKNKQGTGTLTEGFSFSTIKKNLNFIADTSNGYETNILYRGKNEIKSAFSVASTTLSSTSVLNLMLDSGTVAVGYKLRANKLPLNDSTGLVKGDFYISGNTIKVKR